MSSGRIDAGMTMGGSGDSRIVDWYASQHDYMDLLRLQDEGKIKQYDESEVLKGWVALVVIILLMVLIAWFIRSKL